VIKDRTEGTGRFNLAAGALATMVGIGAALSTGLGGFLIQHWNYRASFLGLAAIALMACVLLWAAFPETLTKQGGTEKVQSKISESEGPQSQILDALPTPSTDGRIC
jgi:MFS family permease